MISIMDMEKESIVNSIRKGRLKISVIGLGKIGLSVACLFAETGAQVIGADVNRLIVKLVNQGKNPTAEDALARLVEKNVGKKRLIATVNVKDAAYEGDVIIIVVPTQIDKMKRPDYSSVEKACRDVGRGLRKGSLIIFESTIGPGLTENFVKGIIERVSGLKAGADFGLAYSPVRASPGRILQDIISYPRIVGGIDNRSLEVACAVLSTIIEAKMIRVSSISTAETVKLFENVYRDVNIALANELAIFCEKFGVDFEEVKNAANTQPYCHLHTPSVGVGGPCIPVNPYFLIEEADAINVKLRMVKLARKINEKMPIHSVRLIEEALRVCKKTLRRAKVAVLGISYKANVKEEKFSPAKVVIDILSKKGARIRVYDPYFTAEEVRRMGYSAVTSIKRTVEEADCVFVTINHDEFKQLKLEKLVRYLQKPAAIVDGWAVFNPEKVKKLGLIYRGVGRGGQNH